MRVVDQQRQRPAPGEIGGEAIEAVQDRERSLRPERQGRGFGLRDVEECRRIPRRTLEGAVATTDRGLEQLPHDAEAERALELGPPSRQRPQPNLARTAIGRRDEHGLTDPRRPLNDNRPSLAGGHRLDARPDQIKLHTSLKELNRLAMRHRAHL